MINDEDEILYHIYDIQQIKKNTYVSFIIVYHVLYDMYHKNNEIHVYRIP